MLHSPTLIPSSVLIPALDLAMLNTPVFPCFVSTTQPVVVEHIPGEKPSGLAQRTPSVFLIGSRWNLAMLANTLTMSTKLRQSDGLYLKLGKDYKKHFNAK